MIFKFNNYGENLVTRKRGAEAKKDFDKIYNSTDEVITLDFEGVSIVNNSFIDEIVGKKISEVGFEVFQEKTTFKNIEPFIAICIKKVVENRTTLNN